MTFDSRVGVEVSEGVSTMGVSALSVMRTR